MTVGAVARRLTAKIRLGGRAIMLYDGPMDRFRSHPNPAAAVRAEQARGLVFSAEGTGAEPLARLQLRQLTGWIRRMEGAGGKFVWPPIVRQQAKPDAEVEVLAMTLSTTGYVNLDLRFDLSPQLVSRLGVPAAVKSCFTASTLGFGVSYQARPEKLPVVRVADDLGSLFAGS